jgi:hypothetical protein
VPGFVAWPPARAYLRKAGPILHPCSFRPHPTVLVRSWAEQDVETLTQSGARVVGDISELLPSARAVDTGGPDLDDLERAAGQALALLSGLASDTKNS